MRVAAALSGGLLRQGLGSIRLGESRVGLFGVSAETFVDEDGTMAILILTRIMSGASICRYANRHLCPARTPGTTPRGRVRSPNARFSETFGSVQPIENEQRHTFGGTLCCV